MDIENEERVNIATSIRQFFRDLFGSRYVERLEIDLATLRNDYENRLLEKEKIIAELRAERAALQAKIITYEATLLPHASRAGADLVKLASRPEKPNFPDFIMGPEPIMTKWQMVQKEWAEEQERLAAAEEAERKQKEANKEEVAV